MFMDLEIQKGEVVVNQAEKHNKYLDSGFFLARQGMAVRKWGRYIQSTYTKIVFLKPSRSITEEIVEHYDYSS